jgi:hypothetical protein
MPIDLPPKCGMEDLQAIITFALGGLAITFHLLHFVNVADVLFLMAGAG